MRPDQERFETELVAELPRRATRRGILSSAAKLAGGGALAVAFAGTSVGLAGAQDDDSDTDSDQRGGGGRRRGTRGGGGRRAAAADAPAADAPAADAPAAAAPAADAPAGAGGALPGVGVGSTVRENSGSLAGLVGVAAAGAAALAVVSRRSSVEGTSEV